MKRRDRENPINNTTTCVIWPLTYRPLLSYFGEILHTALNALIFNNTKESRFEFFVHGTTAVINYAIGPEVIIFYQSSCVISPEEFPSDMIRYVLEYARLNHLKIVPTCPHVRRYIRQHSTEFFCIGKVFMAVE